MDYYLWMFFSFLKDLIVGFVENIILAILGALETARFLLYKLLVLLLVFTNIGFVIAMVLLVLNIIEAVDGVPFMNTKYFYLMVNLTVAHLAVFNLCRLVRPKNL